MDELERIYRRAGSRKLWSDILTHIHTHCLQPSSLLSSFYFLKYIEIEITKSVQISKTFRLNM